MIYISFFYYDNKLNKTEMSNPKKRNFVLKNIDIEDLNKQYGLTIISNLDKDKEDCNKTTKISDIISEDLEYSVVFLDENKKESKCNATMIDILSYEKIPEITLIKCFWCKHNFDWKPMGCPIKFVNSIIEKSYISQITKDRYYMRENIISSKLKYVLENKVKNFDIKAFPFNHYLTDGIFCSFNCVLAFIKDNNQDIFYKESYSLLHCMYYDLVGKRITKILPAPHWRLLKDYGGSMSIEEFRNTMNMISYKFAFNVREIKDMKSISKIYKETI
jgi:hypothetical protein